ncbi:hypothetical protein [Streptacidiphilus cavernicola]|uniref:RuvC-like resolvase n=1 Tax=Streptacidiphilus cavernicola TaxID=3342716 RepID=A0ABV6VNT5_9ACTN
MSAAALLLPPAPVVIGLDLSLTSTGVARGVESAVALRPGQRRGQERLGWLLGELREHVRDADLVVVEGPAYAAGAQAGHHEMGGLWYLVTHSLLWQRKIPYAVVAPDQRTVYACGTARPARDEPKERRAAVAKGMVRTAVVGRYGVECEGAGRYDKADAVILAAMGLDWLGYAPAALPQVYARALENVAWPEQIPAAAR